MNIQRIALRISLKEKRGFMRHCRRKPTSSNIKLSELTVNVKQGGTEIYVQSNSEGKQIMKMRHK